jgi:hypothetical protein
MKEMGHASLDMIERFYGRLGSARHRAAVVEYAAADSVQPPDQAIEQPKTHAI